MQGGHTVMRKLHHIGLLIALVCLATGVARAQSFRVQCPPSTVTHPVEANNNSEPTYVGPTYTVGSGYPAAPANVNGAIKCQQISGGDGYSTMGDGTQTYMFSFGPLSGLADIANGQPGTEFPSVFNTPYSGTPLLPGDPATTGLPAFTYNGAVGLVPETYTNALGNPVTVINGHVDARPIEDVGVMNGNIPAPLMAIDEDDEFFLTLTNVGMIMRPDLFEQHTVHFHGYPNASSFYDGVPDASLAINIGGSFTYYYLAPDAGTYFWHCHITPPEHLQMGMVGQLYVRPRQNRTPAGTDVYQTSLLQQNDLRTACHPGLPAAGQPGPDILCSAPLPAVHPGFLNATGYKYVYNDGDGSTRYDVDVPIQIHGFDPNFHFVGMTFNPEGFSDMKDKYFLLNGRSYPDTVGVAGGPADVLGQLAGASNPEPTTHAITTTDTDSLSRASQPLPTLITLSASGGPVSATCPAAPCGQRAALRIADLDVQEYQTLSSIGIPMQLVGFNAKLLRDQAGNNMYVTTNSITLGGGESLDVILDSTGVPPGTYFLYTPQLDHLSNDAENFGGLMTEVVVTP